MNRQAVHLNAHEVTPVGLWSLRAKAPTVATVVSLNFPGLTPQTRDLMRRRTRTALQCLVNTGARPILVDSSARELPDPAGRVLSEWTRPNGLVIRRIAQPIGVIGMIFESRPNVAADAAAICLIPSGR